MPKKVAIVTGSTHGIGEAISRRFARDGIAAVITGRSVDAGEAIAESIRDSGGEAIYIRADLSDESQVEALMTRTVTELGGIDILVNNAAPTDTMIHQERDKRCTDIKSEDFEYILKVGLFAPFWAAKYALPSMMERGGGNIINISSTAGVNAVPDLTAYACAKGGLQAFTKLVAIDYGIHGVRSNCIVVGYVRDAGIGSLIFDDPVTGPMFRGVSMLNKVGKPDNIAGLAAFLVSDDAEFITGQLIPCDGGLSARLATPQALDRAGTGKILDR